MPPKFGKHHSRSAVCWYHTYINKPDIPQFWYIFLQWSRISFFNVDFASSNSRILPNCAVLCVLTEILLLSVKSHLGLLNLLRWYLCSIKVVLITTVINKNHSLQMRTRIYFLKWFLKIWVLYLGRELRF